jgi:hypothetical protein
MRRRIPERSLVEQESAGGSEFALRTKAIQVLVERLPSDYNIAVTGRQQSIT